MSTPKYDDETERDAWLSEALRHAPDAQAAPPSALSDAILRQARAATKPASSLVTARPKPAWAAAWDWLARPPVAAGFASVMVAALVGSAWWDQPIDPPSARPPAADALPAAAPLPAPPVQPAPATAPVPSVAPAAGDLAQRSTAKAAPPPQVERELAAPDSLARSAPLPRRNETAPEPFAERRAAADTAPAMPRHEDADSPRPAALGAVLASVGAQPGRWQWQRGGPVQPMTPALQRWLGRLDAATAARWRNDLNTASAGEASVLRLYRDGALAATLRIDDESVALGQASRATLPAAKITALKQALDDAAP